MTNENQNQFQVFSSNVSCSIILRKDITRMVTHRSFSRISRQVIELFVASVFRQGLQYSLSLWFRIHIFLTFQVSYQLNFRYLYTELNHLACRLRHATAIGYEQTFIGFFLFVLSVFLLFDIG